MESEIILMKTMKRKPESEIFKGMMRIILSTPDRGSPNVIDGLCWLASHCGQLYQKVKDLESEIKILKRRKHEIKKGSSKSGNRDRCKG